MYGMLEERARLKNRAISRFSLDDDESQRE